MQPNIKRHYAFYNHRILKLPYVDVDSCSECSNDAVNGSPKNEKIILQFR